MDDARKSGWRYWIQKIVVNHTPYEIINNNALDTWINPIGYHNMETVS